MKSTVLGYPRIGPKRELKFATENYWKGKMDEGALLEVAATIRRRNWETQKDIGIDLIPSNDFSLYDQVLDASLMVGCIPERFEPVKAEQSKLDLYFAMARGYQDDRLDVKAMEMTKWFDSNYHYIVPEFTKNQQFQLFDTKVIEEFKEGLSLGIKTKPVLLGPVTFLMLGKEKDPEFNRIDLIENLLPVYDELLHQLDVLGADYVQIDEPVLSLDLTKIEQDAIRKTYHHFNQKSNALKIILTTYFDCCGDNLDMVLTLPVTGIHLDLVRCSAQLDDVLENPGFNKSMILSLGVVDGRNIWKNDFQKSIKMIDKARAILGSDNLWVGSSCSLLHCPIDLDLEINESVLDQEIKRWLAFAKQKLIEITHLKHCYIDPKNPEILEAIRSNAADNSNRKAADSIHNTMVQKRLDGLNTADFHRNSEFPIRQAKQKQALSLPLFPTTTIGSFPQTREVRQWRSKYKKKQVDKSAYEAFLEKETEKVIRFQEASDLDVLVHGEYERNDMVEYFGEKLEGFIFSDFGWVQSYGSRCVKPPIIFGDVFRPSPMTVKWAAYAQSLTSKPVKGMLTGPVTILQWSFVRDDQPRDVTCKQIALAIRDEVIDLEKAGLKVIQIDEPALREGLLLRKKEREDYLQWAVEAFKIASGAAKDETQIHTHMCYSEFNDIIHSIAAMDADVITIETSRSAMELLEAFVYFRYPNEIGPGVYDIHSPRVPSQAEMLELLDKASKLIPAEHLWLNPDCGLKTRDWPETKAALTNMVNTAKKMRATVLQAE